MSAAPSTHAPLPIDAVLPDLIAALAAHGRAVLSAPPGAGKTTRVPLALLEAGAFEGRLVMLEPRRLAARAAAERLASSLGEAPGGQVGYRMRGESRISKDTRIEVVTEGILTRMLQDDPSLEGIGALVFDEFHERSLNADLGLALAWEARQALRDDLKLVVMSATLDAAPVAALLEDAPQIASEGRAFPVETRHADRQPPMGRGWAEAMAALVEEAAGATDGSVLAFLPGRGEIGRVAKALAGRLPPDMALHQLFGAMEIGAQRAAIAPPATGRKLVLATAIAETSLTIEGVTCVVDGGLARRARFDPGSGMTRLVTERVSRAEAEQRRGRSGRLGPGLCYRLWPRAAEGALPSFPPAEIESADLAGLALELAVWGAADPAELPFLTPPPDGTLAEARALLSALGAIDAHGATDHGRRLARLPLHPRIGHLLSHGGAAAAPLAALLSDQDILRGAPSDLSLRLEALRDPRKFAAERPFQIHRPGRERVAQEAKRLARAAPKGGTAGLSAGQLAALAYPDRVGLRRKGEAPRFLLSGGKGAMLDAADPLAGARLIVVTDSDGDPREARIRQAIRLTEAELREVHGPAIAWHDSCEWSRREGRVVARRQERFGAIALDDRPWQDAPPEAVAAAMLNGVRQMGLRPAPRARRLLARVALGRQAGLDLFDPSEEALLATADEWLLPHLAGLSSAEGWKRFDITPALEARLGWDGAQALDRAVPPAMVTPLGRKLPIDYGTEAPSVAVRLQELFGLTRHPMAGGQPVRLELLSPAGRPVQVTTDLPGFWASSYDEVRKEMRGRYPKHPWPEDPTAAEPTLRAKRRKGS